MDKQDSILETKYLRWIRRFITPRQMPETIIEQQQAKQLLFYLFMVSIGTGLNLLLWLLSGNMTSFTWLGFIASTTLYICAYSLHYKTGALITTLTAFILPFLLFIFSPDELTIVVIIFLLIIGLMISSQFLSFQSNLQVSILVVISVFFLNTVASSSSALSFISIFIPVMTVVFMSLLNSYGREQLIRIIRRNESPQNHEFFHRSIALMPEAIIIQVDKIIVAVNTASVRLVGIEAEALLGRNVSDFVSTGSSTNYAIDHEAENLTVRYEDELIQEGHDSTCDVIVTASSIHYAGQLATLMILYPKTLNHISSESPPVLDENDEATFRRVAEMISNYAYALDIDADENTRFAWLSGQYQTWTGLAHDEIMSLGDWSTIIHEDDRAFYHRRYKMLLKGESHALEYRIIQTKGAIRWVQDSAYPIYDDRGEHVIRILSIVIDVTDIIRIQEIRQAQIVQQAVVAELGLLALNSNDLNQVMQHATILCEQVLIGGFVAIFEHDRKEGQLRCVNLSKDVSALQIGVTIGDDYLQSMAAYTLNSGDVLISEDLADEPRFKPLQAILDARYMSATGIVIMGNNNTPYGVLTVYSRSKHNFSQEEIYFLQAIANIPGNFIERNRAQTAEREQAEFTRALGEASAAINSHLELPQVLGKIMTYLQEAVPQTQQASIMLRDESTGLYYHYTTWGFAEDTLESTSRYAFSTEDYPLLKDMTLTRQAVNVVNVSKDERWIVRDTVSKTHSYLGAPIILNEDVIGFINLHAYTESAFSERDTTRLKIFAETTGNAIANAQKKEDLEYKVQQRTLELKQQSEQLSTILSASGDGIFYAENFQIVFVNDALCRMTGYSNEDFKGQTTTIFRPDDVSSKTHKLQSALSVASFGEPLRESIRLQCKDGTIFEAELTITRVESSDETVFRTVTIVRDISEQRKLEELKKTFIAIAAHDLRSPISSLQMRMHMGKSVV